MRNPARVAGRSGTAMLTDTTSGVGFEAAKGLAQLGAHVVLVCRNDERAQETRARIRDEVGAADLRVAHADFASLAQVRQLGTVLRGDYPEIDHGERSEAGHAPHNSASPSPVPHSSVKLCG